MTAVFWDVAPIRGRRLLEGGAYSDLSVKGVLLDGGAYLRPSAYYRKYGIKKSLWALIQQTQKEFLLTRLRNVFLHVLAANCSNSC